MSILSFLASSCKSWIGIHSDDEFVETRKPEVYLHIDKPIAIDVIRVPWTRSAGNDIWRVPEKVWDGKVVVHRTPPIEFELPGDPAPDPILEPRGMLFSIDPTGNRIAYYSDHSWWIVDLTPTGATKPMLVSLGPSPDHMDWAKAPKRPE